MTYYYALSVCMLQSRFLSLCCLSISVCCLSIHCLVLFCIFELQCKIVVPAFCGMCRCEMERQGLHWEYKHIVKGAFSTYTRSDTHQKIIGQSTFLLTILVCVIQDIKDQWWIASILAIWVCKLEMGLETCILCIAYKSSTHTHAQAHAHVESCVCDDDDGDWWRYVEFLLAKPRCA